MAKAAQAVEEESGHGRSGRGEAGPSQPHLSDRQFTGLRAGHEETDFTEEGHGQASSWQSGHMAISLLPETALVGRVCSLPGEQADQTDA